MQEEYCNLKRLLNKREDRLARAQTISITAQLIQERKNR